MAAATTAARLKLMALVVAPLYALDQATKWLVHLNMFLGEARTIIPGFFDLVYVVNTGAAFGTFRDSNWFFVVLSVVTAAVLLFLFFRGSFEHRVAQFAVLLLLAGIFGNLTDRLIHGHVIDFLDFYIGGWHWPAFNVADSCICVAAGLLILHSAIETKKSS